MSRLLPNADVFPEGVHRRIYQLLSEHVDTGVSAWDLVYLTHQPSATRRLREVRQELHEHGWDVETMMVDGVHRYYLKPLPGDLAQDRLFK